VTTTDDAWRPSARELERRAIRRRRARRDVLLATVALVVVLGGLALVLTSAPGWPRVKATFFNWHYIHGSFHEVTTGLVKNIAIFMICEPVILVLGAGVAIVRSTASPLMLPFRVLAVIYADVVRGIPTLLLVYLFGFGIPALNLQGLTTSTFWLGSAALVVSYTAYVSEVFRAGIESVHPSQVASADALGLSRWQSMLHVILPQATRRVAPPLLNDFISLQKDTALLSVITVFEAFFSAQDYENYKFNYSSLTLAAICFVVLTVPFTRFTDWLTRRARRRELAGVGP
jgi:polar amino acid transport system permease protein